MRGEGDAVGAAAYWEGLEGLWAGWGPLRGQGVLARLAWDSEEEGVA